MSSPRQSAPNESAEPPGFIKHDGLYCYDDGRALQFLHWRVDDKVQCDQRVSDAVTKADVEKTRREVAVVPQSAPILAITSIGLAALLVGFIGGFFAGRK